MCLGISCAFYSCKKKYKHRPKACQSCNFAMMDINFLIMESLELPHHHPCPPHHRHTSQLQGICAVWAHHLATRCPDKHQLHALGAQLVLQCVDALRWEQPCHSTGDLAWLRLVPQGQMATLQSQKNPMVSIQVFFTQGCK